ncbi:hypothetical protein [Paraburkholderia sp. J7]|uniref:hypothetical protein n=1 Tax=Paraburkholderia sp. J7 TaxID=2805438 RepID=UPI002AB75854|nr:hypothetical protein [Paraburkholderia sp. J7]
MNAHSIRLMPCSKPTMTTRSPTMLQRERQDPGRRARAPYFTPHFALYCAQSAAQYAE